ncbi:LCP family protein [Streptomyces sp. t39]|uniref:LCP family protein n=1 Tax=Streptomyces sp. t39 TaxID=1828156 RepID=UPI0011CE096D|nr:LCP family protein [Streptomyces sp. t39]TXS55118.1 LytR family transcriptional regulator [Streptomyces sp. t39]
MNDQHDSYDPYGQQPRIVGYDEYGQPVYQQPQQYDPYAQQSSPYPQQPQDGGQGAGGRGYDPYAPQDPYAAHDPYATHDPYAAQRDTGGYGRAPGDGYGDTAGGGYGDTAGGGYGTEPGAGGYGNQQYGSGPAGQGQGYDPYGYDTGTQPAVDTTQQWNIPQQQAAPAAPEAPAVPEQRRAEAGDGDVRSGGDVRPGGDVRDAGDRDYRTEQFAFIEEPDEDSEDVIDWLKFTESRSERREEAKRRGRNRVVALAVVLALALVGGVGYLWYAGKLPGTSDAQTSAGTAAGPQKRDVIVVHLHNTKSEKTSTALLVDNVTTQQGTTVLLPNTLSVANDDGTATTLGKSVEDDGSTGTREAIGTLLGAKISGTWRLDTPYLENLVELVGTIDLTTDAAVPAAEKGDALLVEKGENQTLDGRAAVAYATWSAPGEAEEKQLQRFGQVMQAVLKKLPDDGASATVIVETLGQILDPSLNEKDLGSSLAGLAEHAKGGDYRTALLPVQQNGTLTEEAADSVVEDVLGGSVSAPEAGAAVRVGVKNATGDTDATEKARISLVNGGYTVIDGGSADRADASRVTYADDAHRAKADEVAKTLGLPANAVAKGKAATNADVSVVLGSDFEGSGSGD